MEFNYFMREYVTHLTTNPDQRNSSINSELLNQWFALYSNDTQNIPKIDLSGQYLLNSD